MDSQRLCFLLYQQPYGIGGARFPSDCWWPWYAFADCAASHRINKITNMKRIPAALVALVLALTGCVSNPYSKFYQPSSIPAEMVQFFQPYSGKTEIFSTTDLESDARTMIRRGYQPLGLAAFEGVRRGVSESGLR